MTSEDSGEDALIKYLSDEKTRSQRRLQSMMLFSQSIQSSSAVINESLEILRQNAESDYDTILHLLTLLRHNYKSFPEDEESVDSSLTSPQGQKTTSPRPSQESSSSIQNEFFLEDPLTEDFDPSLSSADRSNLIPDLIPEDEEYLDNVEQTEENKENGGGEGRRFIRPPKKEDDTAFARSLPVNVPLSRKDFMKNRFVPPEDDIPEDLEKGIAFIMSLKEKSFDLSDPRFSFKVD